MALVQEEQIQVQAKLCAGGDEPAPARAEDAQSDPSTELGSEDSDSD